MSFHLFVFQFSYKKGRKAEYKNQKIKYLEKINIGTTLGVTDLLAPGLFIKKNVNVPKTMHRFDVMAWQWGWQYRLPGEDGKLYYKKVN